MSNQENQFDLNEETETLMNETTDEALEAAACSGPVCGRSFTVAMCTGGAECPY